MKTGWNSHKTYVPSHIRDSTLKDIFFIGTAIAVEPNVRISGVNNLYLFAQVRPEY
jgi:purine-nucleoside phosphorylase